MQVHIQKRIPFSSPEITDAMLVKQTLAGDENGFELLVRRYQKPLFGLIMGIVHDYDLASDITQNVFVQLYLTLTRTYTALALKAWLFTVARHRCLDD